LGVGVIVYFAVINREDNEVFDYFSSDTFEGAREYVKSKYGDGGAC